MGKFMSCLMSVVLGVGICLPGGTLQAVAEEAQSGAPASASTEAAATGAQGAPQSASGQGEMSAATDTDQAGAASSSAEQGSVATASAATDEPASATAPSPAAAPAAPQDEAAASDENDANAIWVDSTTGSDDNDGSSQAKAFKTLTAVAAALKANPGIAKVHLAGTFNAPATFDVPGGVALEVAQNTTMTGAGSDGIVLESGATLSCAAGAQLTMSGFKTALTVKDGAEVNDGSYVLDGNYSAFALKGSGSLHGTARTALTVSAKGSTGKGAGSAFSYQSDSRFTNCTVDVEAPQQLSEEYAGLYLQNASLTTRGVWYYFDPSGGKGGLHMDGSDFTAYKATGSSSYRQVMSLLGTSDIKNGSTLTADGSRVTVSAKLTVDDSKVVIRNSADGGLNVNYKPGEATFTNSTLETTGMRYTPSYGAGQSSGPCSITFRGNSVVNTDAKDKTADDGGANRDTGSSYVVTGGSYLVAYSPSYNHDVTTPTNGAENGNEWLSLFTLADPSVSQLNPINANGTRYDYPVANPSKDGQKHVWTPAAKVTFALNDGNATFADGTTADKTAQTVRGYTLGTVTGNDFAVDLGTPVDAQGTKFLGWYYRDAAGVEHAYDYATTEFDADTEVYAKWDAKTVVYHNGEGANFIQNVAQDASDATVLSFDDVAKNNDAFNIPGREFSGWNTAPDGSGVAVEAGSAVAFGGGQTQVDLYAQYTQDAYRVGFSANGGTFSDTSIFKQHPDVFTIEHDATGGEVAYLTAKAQYDQKLWDLLGSVSHNDLTPGKAAASLMGASLADENKWYADPEGAGKSYRFDDHKFWFLTLNGDNPQIEGDTVYYLKWKDAKDVQTVAAENELNADLWGDAGSGSQADSTSVLRVKADGAGSFSLTGAVDVAPIKQQMASIEAQFGEDASDFENIKLANATSTFTATITLPDGVKVPATPQVQAKGLGTCFKVTNVAVGGNKITVTLGLNQVFANYRQLKDAVDSTGVATDDKSALDPISDAIELTVSGMTLDSSAVANGDDLVATGTVEGSFDARAQGSSGKVKRFAFTWNGAQIGAGRDAGATDDATIQQTLLVKKPYESEIAADMQASVLPENATAADLAQAGTDTEHTRVMGVFPGSKLNVTGSIDATSVKNQMTTIEQEMGKTDPAEYESIALSNLSSSFTATFTLPDGLSFPQGLSASQLAIEGFSDTFSIENATVSGNTLTVVFGLKDGIANYRQLKDAVDALGNTMKVTVPGVVVDASVADGTTLTMKGGITGTFDAVATTAAGTEKDFSFKWTGAQTPDGRDVLLSGSDDDSLQLTVKTPEPMQSDLVSDILVRTGDGSHETEHDAIFDTTAGSTLDLVGAVDTSGIVNQMKAIEAEFNNPAGESIDVDVRDFGFRATFTLGQYLSFPTGITAADIETLGFDPGFKVASAQVDGDTLTIDFALAHPEDVKTYADLKSIVEAAGVPGDVQDMRWMKVIVPGVKVAQDAPVGTNLSATGTLVGTFKALATSLSGSQQAFSFTWNSGQWDKGADAAAPDDPAIRFSAVVKEKPVNPEEPGNPENPGMPTVPDNPGASDGGTGSGEGTEPAGAPDTDDVEAMGEGTAASGNAPKTGDPLLPIAATAGAMAVAAGACAVRAARQRGRVNGAAHAGGRAGRR